VNLFGLSVCWSACRDVRPYGVNALSIPGESNLHSTKKAMGFMDIEPIEVLAEGKYLKLVKAGCWEYADRTRGIRAVAIVAVTRNQELILTEQFRVPIGKPVIDLPAGLVGDEAGQEDEADELAARRELLEETGFEARTLKPIVSGPTTAGMATEIVTIYLATGVRQVNAGGGVTGEEIQVHVVPLTKVMSWLKRSARDGKLIDVKTHFAAAWLVEKHKARN